MQTLEGISAARSGRKVKSGVEIIWRQTQSTTTFKNMLLVNIKIYPSVGKFDRFEGRCLKVALQVKT